MSKTKFGLSFLTALAMMLVFSIAAMAAGVTSLKANVENGFVKASWTKDDAATGYTVDLKDGTTVLETKTVVQPTEGIVVNFTSAAAVTESKKYTLVVTSTGVVTPNTSTVDFWAPASNKEITSTDKDNNIGNANQTGTGVTTNDGSKNTDVIKSTGMVKNDGTTGTHRTHGEYQNNTNSCASCHQTHTGASKSLLFKDGVYNTCTACHDGTLGFYNVFEHSNAGTFGGTEAGNMSIHLADGSVQAKAAPGGNLSANTGAWINEFNCASCHSPHGSYSDRLLHYNPNGMGLATSTEGGIGLKDAKIYNWPVPAPAATSNAKQILVRGTATNFGLLAADIDAADPATTKVIYAYDLNSGGTAYVKSTKPWLYGYKHASPNKNYYTRFWVTETNTDVSAPDNTIKIETDGTQHYEGAVDNHDQDWNANLKIVWSKGFIYAKNGDTILDNLTKGNVGRAYTVDLDLVEIAKFGDANGVPIYKSNVDSLYDGTKAGSGIQMSNYCASCHTDYLAKSGSATGTFNQAYRHTTTSDSYTCVRCHYAHGTDVTVMMDAEGRDADELVTEGVFADTAAAEAYLLDKNPSSALKRYTNMSVCWGCHTDSKAEQLKNTSSYGDNTDPDQPDPHGLVPQGEMPGELANPNAAIFPTQP